MVVHKTSVLDMLSDNFSGGRLVEMQAARQTDFCVVIKTLTLML